MCLERAEFVDHHLTDDTAGFEHSTNSFMTIDHNKCTYSEDL